MPTEWSSLLIVNIDVEGVPVLILVMKLVKIRTNGYIRVSAFSSIFFSPSPRIKASVLYTDDVSVLDPKKVIA